MLLSRSAPITFRCNACQQTILSAFTACAGIKLQPLRATRSPQTLRLKTQQRPFAETSREANTPDTYQLKSVDTVHDSEIDAELDTGTDGEHHPEPGSIAENADTTPGDTYIPWYLQEQAKQPLQEQHPFSERQRIPDLPSNPPPILQPVLEHVSVDLGLDDLSILDLRGVDPPPALGGNLIMIIGTARSEKHLHVSADRHCRWLRSTYKLNPFADGLLGRNEIKLKLRRKARRSKLLRNVGAKEEGELDDGLRTGWVCVNIGKVDPAAAIQSEADEETQANFVGFGRASEGVRLVVQMFTEETRGQFDLETLWSDIAQRAAKRKAKENELRETRIESAEDADIDSKNSQGKDPTSAAITDSAKPLEMRFTPLQQTHHFGGQQVRTFHSSSRRSEAVEIENSAVTSSFGQSLDPDFSPESISNQTVVQMASRKLDSVGNLQVLIQQLKEAPPNRIRQLIGQGPFPTNPDKSRPTTFMNSVLDNFPPFPDTAHWICMIELVKLGVQACALPASTVVRALCEMRQAGEPIPRAMYVSLLKIVTQDGRSFRQNDHALRVIDMMAQEDHSIFTEDIFQILHSAKQHPGVESSITSTTEKSTRRLSKALENRPAAKPYARISYKERVLAAMDHFHITFSSGDAYLPILQTYASIGNWPSFSFVWNSMARRLLPRSAAHYALYYGTLADTGDKLLVMKMLPDAVSDMSTESPSVAIQGDVAKAITRCVYVIVPALSSQSFSFQEMKEKGQGEWLDLLNKCQKALKAERAV